MEEKTTPLRKRMIEDMNIRGMGDKAQKAHIRAIKDFAGFLGRSPDTATPEELRAYQLHMTETGVTPPTFNARIMALRLRDLRRPTGATVPSTSSAPRARRRRCTPTCSSAASPGGCPSC